MTLPRLALAWLPVAAWFTVAGFLRFFIVAHRLREGAVALPSPLAGRTVGWLLAEAAAVTLFASLWFDSLGSGGWWLLFAIVGFLAGFPTRMQHAAFAPVRRLALLDGLIDVARYVVAGGLLAWRLN